MSSGIERAIYHEECGAAIEAQVTLPANITADVLAYHAAHRTDLACFVRYEHARRDLGEDPDGEALASIEALGRQCDASYAERRAAQTAMLQAIEQMEVSK